MKVYRLQINYKSGISMQAEFSEFEYSNGTYSWKCYGDTTPALFGADNVESVWQLSVREAAEVAK